MLPPRLLARVVKRRELARKGVGRGDAPTLGEVAVPAGEAEISGVAAAPENLGDDMVYREVHTHHGLPALAVGATKIEVGGHLAA